MISMQNPTKLKENAYTYYILVISLLHAKSRHETRSSFERDCRMCVMTWVRRAGVCADSSDDEKRLGVRAHCARAPRATCVLFTDWRLRDQCVLSVQVDSRTSVCRATDCPQSLMLSPSRSRNSAKICLEPKYFCIHCNKKNRFRLQSYILSNSLNICACAYNFWIS